MRVAERVFEQLVEEALAAVPTRYRSRMRNIVMVVEGEPRERGLLGLYEGRPLTERNATELVAMPDRITIYQGPHQRASRTLAELRALVHETVWHEIGHYFGMDERQVREAERRRARRRRL